MDQSEFLEMIEKVNLPDTDLSKFVYQGYLSKSVAICTKPSHGEYLVSAYRLKSGSKCPKCMKEARDSKYDIEAATLEFIKASEAIFPGKYSYEKTIVIGNKDTCIITCLKGHGDIVTRPGRWLYVGNGCPKCGLELGGLKRKVTIEKFRKESLRVHGDSYLIPDQVIESRDSACDIICKKCQEMFRMSYNQHRTGQKCPNKCYDPPHPNLKSLDEIREQGAVVHKGKYTIRDQEVLGYLNPIRITCPVEGHGDFERTPQSYRRGAGCPRCHPAGTSRSQMDLRDIIRGWGLEVKERVRILDGKEIDIFIPSLNIGIEFHGLHWHSELYRKDNYHRDKFLAAEKLGIFLIQIFEDEWLARRDIVVAMLKVKLGATDEKIFARKTEIADIDSKAANEFYETYHIQGPLYGKFRSKGLMHEGSLVAVMSFSDSNTISGITELCRFVSKGIVVGGFSKLLKNWIIDLRTEGITEIVSYSDNRWSKGDVYLRSGFRLVRISRPRYYWVKHCKRYHRRGFQKKILLKKAKFKFDPNKTEVQNCHDNGFYRIWDAGIKTWNINI